MGAAGGCAVLLWCFARRRAAFELKSLDFSVCGQGDYNFERRRPAVPVVARRRLEGVSATLRAPVAFLFFVRVGPRPRHQTCGFWCTPASTLQPTATARIGSTTETTYAKNAIAIGSRRAERLQNRLAAHPTRRGVQPSATRRHSRRPARALLQQQSLHKCNARDEI